MLHGSRDNIHAIQQLSNQLRNHTPLHILPHTEFNVPDASETPDSGQSKLCLVQRVTLRPCYQARGKLMYRLGHAEREECL